MTGVGITIGGGVSNANKPSHDSRPQVVQQRPPRDQPTVPRVSRRPARTAIHEGGATKEDVADPVPLQDAAPTTTTATTSTASSTTASAPVIDSTETTTASPPAAESDSQSSSTPATSSEETKAEEDTATASEPTEEPVVANAPTDSHTSTSDETTSVAPPTETSTETKVEAAPSPFEELDALVAASSLSEADEKLGIMLSLLESRRATDPRWCSEVLWRAAQLAYLHAAKGQKTPQQKTVRQHHPLCFVYGWVVRQLYFFFAFEMAPGTVHQRSCARETGTSLV